MDEQELEQAAFERAFNGEPESAASSTAAPEGAVAEVTEPEPAAEPQAQEPAEAVPETPAEPAKAEPKAGDLDDDPVLLDGLKRSELHRLFSNAAEVEQIKRQLDKAHGHIGELNRRLQQSPAPAAAPAAVPELPPELKQFEDDFPEVAQYVKALGLAKQPVQEQPAPQQEPAQAGADPVALELLVMDRMHKGWRDKVASQEFSLWMTTQGTQASFDTAHTADELSAVLGQYDQWATARTAAADKAAKGQQRLKAATTPAGNAPRPQTAPTEQDAFVSGFKSVLAR